MALSYNLTTLNRPMPRGGLRGTGSNMLFDLNRQINRLFDDFFDTDEDKDARFAPTRFASPAMDVTELDNRYDIAVELPGVSFDDVELRVEDHVLTIKGEKKSTITDVDSERTWTERRYGEFQRRIQLPQDIDEEHIEAEFENGVLNITMPRTEATERGRTIAVKNQKTGRKTGSKTRLVDSEDAKVKENA